MECIFLGTGTALTNEKRHNTSLFISHNAAQDAQTKNAVIDGAQGVLVDCNGVCVQRLRQAAIDYTSIRHIFLTHHHIDHIGALGCFMQQLWLASCYGKAEGAARTAPLHFYGNAKTLASVKALFAALEIEEAHSSLFKLIYHELTVDGGVLDIDGVQYRYFPNRHSVPCFGLSVQGQQQKLVYSGDSEVYAPIYEGLTAGDILIHECNALDGPHAKGHANWPELQALLADLPPIMLYLVHLPDMAEEEEVLFAKTLKEDAPASVTLGTDGGRFRF